MAPLGVPAVALLPIHTSSPERRITQKEIIAGEERPKYVLQSQYKPSPTGGKSSGFQTRDLHIRMPNQSQTKTQPLALFHAFVHSHFISDTNREL